MKRLLLALALVASAVSYGETKTYTGADNGDWFADGNWDPEGVPTAADDVMIAGKRVKAQTGAIVANSLTLAGESELYLGKARNFSSRKTAQFGTLYPGVTVNVKGGCDYTGNTSDHQFVKQSGEDGTFRYVKPTGVVLIVR